MSALFTASLGNVNPVNSTSFTSRPCARASVATASTASDGVTPGVEPMRMMSAECAAIADAASIYSSRFEVLGDALHCCVQVSTYRRLSPTELSIAAFTPAEFWNTFTNIPGCRVSLVRLAFVTNWMAKRASSMPEYASPLDGSNALEATIKWG